ncbi:MAG: peptidoglycan editing factor PgeF [Rhodanobacteraceae bacterium]
MDSGCWIVPDWPIPANIRAAVTTRLFPGNSTPPFDAFNLGANTGENVGIVRANRMVLERALALPAAPRWLSQTHGTGVASFDAVVATEVPEADAAIARDSGIVLAVLTADCLPLLLCADDASEIAVVHAGWRGLSAGVIEATIDKLTSPRSHVLAWLGPAIGRASYEVGDEVRSMFVRTDEGTDSASQPRKSGPATRGTKMNPAAAFDATRPGHWHCDLELLARQRLRAQGVTRIYGGGFDTASDERLYSYRRDGRTGRFASLIWRTR